MRSFSGAKSGLKLAAAVSLLTLASACSPTSLFSHDSKPQPIEPQQYHPINSACSHLDLSAPNMKGHELRAILNCFNSYGALDPMKRLFDRLSDAQVEAFADVGNEYLIQDHSFLYEMERSYFDEKDSKALDASMQSVSRLFENPDLAASALALMDPGSDKDLSDDAIGIVQTLGNHLDEGTVANSFSIGMSVASSRAFYSLQSELRPPRSDSDQNDAPYDLPTLVGDFLELLHESQTPGSFSLIDALNHNYETGDLPIALDTLFGLGSDDVARNVPTLSPVFSVLGQNDGEILKGFGELTRALSKPLQCLRGTKADPDPVMHLFQDIASQPDGQAGHFLAHQKLLTLVALEPLCDFPEALKNDYPKVVELADSPAMYGAERAIKAAFAIRDADGSRPLADLIRNFLADPKTEDLLPFIQDLSAKNAWSDLFLLLSMPNNADRDRMFSGLSVLADSSPYLGGRSAKDALTDLVLANGADPLLALAKAAKGYVNQEPSFLYPVLDGFRSAYYANDAHPFVNLAANLMKAAPQHKLFFDTLFSMAKYPEFKQSLALLSAMAKDGRLKELYGASVAILHGFAQQSRHQVNVTKPVKLFSAVRRHNLDSADLDGTGTKLTPASSACAQLGLTVPLDDTADPTEFNRQWNQFLGCLTSEGGYKDVQSGVNYLRSQSTSQGQDDLSFSIGLVKDLGQDLNDDEIGYLGDLWVQSEDNGNFNQELDTGARFIHEQVVRPLLDIAAPLLNQAVTTLRQGEEWAARVLRHPHFPELAQEVDRLSQEAQTIAPDPSPSPVFDSLLQSDLPRVETWVRNKECENIAPGDDAGVEARAQQVIKGYSDAVSSYEGIDGAPRLSWSLDEVKSMTEPVLERIADPRQSLPNHTLIQAFLNFLGYYSLQPGQQPSALQHFTPQYLAKWFYDRATDRKLITQYYITAPGEHADRHPDVREVDSLDRLELVILNSDFDEMAPLLDKLGIKAGVNLGKLSLAELGNSWGDEPESVWPDEIKAKYRNSRPPTLKETVDHIHAMLDWMKVVVGFPKLPDCEQVDPTDPDDVNDNKPVCHPLPRLKLVPPFPDFPNLPGCMHFPDISFFGIDQIKRRVYNMAQVISVLDENLPGSGTPEDGGLKVLRDIFFQLNYSTPEKYRGQLDGDRNNLSLVTFLARSGILHQIAFDLRRLPPDSPMLNDFFAGVTSLANQPSTAKLIDQLLVQDSSHQLLWALVQNLYPLMGNALPYGGAPRMDALRADQSLYYGLADLQQLGIVGPVIDAASAIVEQHSPYLIRHADMAANLAETYVSRVTRSLYDDPMGAGKQALADIISDACEVPDFAPGLVGTAQMLEDNPATHNSISTFLQRWKQFNDPQQNLAKIGKSLLAFFEDTDGDPRAAETSDAIRHYLADRLDSGSVSSPSDLDQILLLVSKSPDQFENLLDTAATYSQNGDLKDFFAYVRNQLNPVESLH